MQQGLKLGMLTYVHFFVDFACAFWVNYIILFDGTKYVPELICYASYESIPNGNILFWVMLYNFCAFALQLPLGMLLDRLHQKKPWWMAVLGCVLIGIAGVVAFRRHIFILETYYTLPEMIAMSLLLGIGNALFHVGAGVRVLQMGERMTPLGIFISTGAFGICLGSIFCSTLTLSNAFDAEKILTLFLIIMLLLSFAAAGLLLLGAKMDSLKMDVHKNGQRNPWNAVSIFLLVMVVALRSFQGSFVQFSWNTGIPITLMFALCIVGGKALGGILADRFGVSLALIPLFLSALLFLQSENMLFGLGAILLFQTTMPITLSLMHKQLPTLPGTAFGLLSFALFVGYLPKFLCRYYWINLYEDRVSFGKWSLYTVSSHIAKWWIQYQEAYAYSIVTGISFLLLVFLLCLRYRFRKER